jgi:hypothetical protein
MLRTRVILQFQIADHAVDFEELRHMWAEACEDAEASVTRKLIGNSDPGTTNYLYRMHAIPSRIDITRAASRVRVFLSLRYPTARVALQLVA